MAILKESNYPIQRCIVVPIDCNHASVVVWYYTVSCSMSSFEGGSFALATYMSDCVAGWTFALRTGQGTKLDS